MYLIYVCLGAWVWVLHTIYHVIHESIFATPLSLHRNETSTKSAEHQVRLLSRTLCVPIVVPTHLSRDKFKISCSVQMLHKITQMWRRCVWRVRVCRCKHCGMLGTILFCHRLSFRLIFVLVPDSLNAISLNFCSFNTQTNTIRNKTRHDQIWHWTEHLIKQRNLSIHIYICYRNSTSSSFFFFILFFYFVDFLFFSLDLLLLPIRVNMCSWNILLYEHRDLRTCFSSFSLSSCFHCYCRPWCVHRILSHAVVPSQLVCIHREKAFIHFDVLSFSAVAVAFFVLFSSPSILSFSARAFVHHFSSIFSHIYWHINFIILSMFLSFSCKWNVSRYLWEEAKKNINNWKHN